ncbi:MAG: TatD family hydrolase [Actinomycetota bacterium]
MRGLPPLDTHAHVNPDIDPSDLTRLGAVVFAMSRSLDEGAKALSRRDALVLWGVGCHPSVAQAQRSFDSAEFANHLERTALVGEIGLDGSARVPMEEQVHTFRQVLAVIAETPRLVSIHSYRATARVLDELKGIPIRAPILHWWLGTTEETEQAVALGCYFSLNPSVSRRTELLRRIPAERLLTETDHPFGDRRRPNAAPGRVEAVERLIAEELGTDDRTVRRQMWRNLLSVVRETRTGHLIPSDVAATLAAVPP